MIISNQKKPAALGGARFLSNSSVVPTAGWRLTLECGHAVHRPKKRPTPPASTACEHCEMLLDRCEQQTNWWFSANAVKGTHSALQLLVQEGHLEQNINTLGATIYGKINHKGKSK